jgi:hypothetical protein
VNGTYVGISILNILDILGRQVLVWTSSSYVLVSTPIFIVAVGLLFVARCTKESPAAKFTFTLSGLACFDICFFHFLVGCISLYVCFKPSHSEEVLVSDSI